MRPDLSIPPMCAYTHVISRSSVRRPSLHRPGLAGVDLTIFLFSSLRAGRGGSMTLDAPVVSGSAGLVLVLAATGLYPTHLVCTNDRERPAILLWDCIRASSSPPAASIPVSPRTSPRPLGLPGTWLNHAQSQFRYSAQIAAIVYMVARSIVFLTSALASRTSGCRVAPGGG